MDPVTSATTAELQYTTDQRAGIRRVRRGAGFAYVSATGRTIRRAAELRRIRSLAIPPAWKDVWICPEPRGHLQATGRDARGRKQYRYHADWRAVRDETKYHRLIGFAQALPAIRRRTNNDLRQGDLSCEKVLAAVVQLLEKTLIRVGNEEYARHNQSFGLTTLRDRHVEVSGARIRFVFKGKSGVEHGIDLNDRRLARTVKACRDIPGYELFQYYDEAGSRQAIGSGDVNRYLKAITGRDFTSKDFRTWAGTVLAAEHLAGLVPAESDAESKRNIVRAVEGVAARLGNTKAVCRKCYIHPAIIDAYMDGSLERPSGRGARARRSTTGLTTWESAVLGMLQNRLNRDARRRAS